MGVPPLSLSLKKVKLLGLPFSIRVSLSFPVED